MSRSVLYFLLVCGGFCSLCSVPFSPAARQESPGCAGKNDPGDLSCKYQGVSSCASTACHNGAGRNGIKGAEYNTWANNDPHNKAYRVLFDERSLLIAQNLNRGKGGISALAPQTDPLCLGCHILPDITNSSRAPRFAFSDGVGCESCHGPAQQWLTTHYLDAWKAESVNEKKSQGFANTKSLRERAEGCAGCHVGRGERDVNHDLIAAGHPRLRFEFAAFQAVYPKHWSETKGVRHDFEARSWLIGQLVTAEASLDLLQYRALHTDKPWPEFSEYNCAACHHNVTGAAAKRLATAAGRTTTDLRWGSWYEALLPTLDRAMPRPLLSEPLHALAQQMSKRVPDRRQAAMRAAEASALLHRWSLETEKPYFGGARWQSFLRDLSRQRDLAKSDWDGATQVYLGLAALNQALGDIDPAYRAQSSLRDAIRSLGTELETSFPKTRDRLYDSPSNFSPSAVEKMLKEIETQIP